MSRRNLSLCSYYIILSYVHNKFVKLIQIYCLSAGGWEWWDAGYVSTTSIHAVNRWPLLLYNIWWVTREWDESRQEEILVDLLEPNIRKEHVKTMKIPRRVRRGWEYDNSHWVTEKGNQNKLMTLRSLNACWVATLDGANGKTNDFIYRFKWKKRNYNIL